MKIYYINLEHREDRRKQIEEELRRLDLAAERYSAIKNENAPMGCSESHLDLIKKAKNLNLDKIMVLEDDFRFLITKEQLDIFLQRINLIDFDVIMIGYNLIRSEQYNDFLGKVLEAQTTSGYIVHNKFYDKLIKCWEEGLELYKKHPNEHWNYILDQYWKKLQPESKWYYSLERIGKQRESYSDLSKTTKKEEDHY